MKQTIKLPCDYNLTNHESWSDGPVSGEHWKPQAQNLKPTCDLQGLQLVKMIINKYFLNSFERYALKQSRTFGSLCPLNFTNPWDSLGSLFTLQYLHEQDDNMLFRHMGTYYIPPEEAENKKEKKNCICMCMCRNKLQSRGQEVFLLQSTTRKGKMTSIHFENKCKQISLNKSIPH